MPGDLVSEMVAKAITPVAPTPGVNASVAKPQAPQDFPLLPGHELYDIASGRADFDTAFHHPEVIKDRMRAEQELASRFQIVDDKMKGPRLPNQVSAAEFHQLANTYSDIRMGRGDLTIDASTSKDPAQYKADMMDDIADILQTKSGRYLVEHLSNATTIDEDGKEVHHHTTLAPAVTPQGIPDSTLTAEHGSNTNIGAGSLRDDLSPGTGSDALINANPNMDLLEFDENGDPAGRIRSDVGLYHEMVHAYTDTRGFTDWRRVSADDSFISAVPGIHLRDPHVVADANEQVSQSEYQAAGLGLHAYDILTENAYRRERTEVAKSGKGIAGDLLMPQRVEYAGSIDDYQTIGGR